MQFKNSIKDGYVKIVIKDDIRAKSLIKAAENAILSAKELRIVEHNYVSILRELYEALRQYCEAIGYTQGYKFESHESITYFLKDIINNEDLSIKFDRYRQLRNSTNYYGKGIAKETVEKALKDIPDMMSILKEHLKHL